ncbi:(d)CMP kinase [soil metagenome]
MEGSSLAGAAPGAVVAIDGPAGAGKSTVAREVARRLGWSYLDTGALYRGLTVAALEAGVDLRDGKALAALAPGVAPGPGGEGMRVEGRDVGFRLRDEDVTEAVVPVSAHPEVRSAMLERQRSVARESNVVMEGRDIGVEVFPDAPVKIFLTAALDERARRRAEQLGAHGSPHELADLRDKLARRDHRDTTRPESPLRQAPDAVVVDSTSRSLEHVVAEVIRIVQGALAPGRETS